MQKFQYWMMGRNGTDQLALAALIAGLILSVVGQLFFWPLVFVSYLLYLSSSTSSTSGSFLS